MPSSSKIRTLLLFAACVLLSMGAVDLRAQVRINPHVGGNQPAASTRIGAAQANVSQITRGGTNPIRGVGYRGPVGGYGAYAAGAAYPGYGGVYMGQTPANGYLTGAASVIQAQGQFMQDRQQSLLMHQQLEQTALETRKKTFEEWKYEQAALPTAEELRQKREKADIDSARGNPPLTEIRSGSALNILLVNIQKSQGVGIMGPTVPLQPEMLRHINLTDGRSNTGTGLLRDGGKVDWPFPLQNEFFDADRKQVEKLMAQAATEAGTGKVSFKVIKGLEEAEDSMRATLKKHIHDLTPTEGVNARRYLNDLHDTFQTLKDPNVGKYVGGAWSAKGDNVAELVGNMTQQGLKFAPCAEGDDSYYRSLYNALRSYDVSLAQLTSR